MRLLRRLVGLVVWTKLNARTVSAALADLCTTSQIRAFSTALSSASTCLGATSYDWSASTSPTTAQYSEICKCPSVNDVAIPECSVTKGLDKIPLSLYYNWILTTQCKAIADDPSSLYAACTDTETKAFVTTLNAASRGCTASSSIAWGQNFVPTVAQRTELCKCSVASFTAPSCVWPTPLRFSVKDYFLFVYKCQAITGNTAPDITERPNTSATRPPSRTPSPLDGDQPPAAAPHSSSNIGLIVGSIGGGVVVALFIIGCVLWKRTRSSKTLTRQSTHEYGVPEERDGWWTAESPSKPNQVVSPPPAHSRMTTSTDERVRLRKLQTAESLAMLDERYFYQDSSPRTGAPSVRSTDQELSLHISLRLGRLAVLVSVVVVVLMIVTLFLSHGTELTRFERGSLTTTEQEHLLDRYNSYSGNVASALGRALELFVALMAQALVLWFMTESVLAFGSNWRVKLTLLALGVTVGFLLTNGLNALNVQVRELPPVLIMSSSDLSAKVSESNTAHSSTAEFTLSETRLANPSTNTIFRNLILPRASIENTCKGNDFANNLQDDSLIYGLPQRSWMKTFLPNALITSTVRIDLLTNTSNATATTFPSNASIVADLLISGAHTFTQYAPFDVVRPIVAAGYLFQRFPNKWYADIDGWKVIPTARLGGLLPPDPTSSETQDRKWFLTHVASFMRETTAAEWQKNSSLRRWTLDVSRVQITPLVSVDAVTIESEVMPTNYSMDVDVASSTGQVIVQPEGRYPDTNGRYLDAQIHAYAVCLNANGTETLFSKVKSTLNTTNRALSTTNFIDCRSQTSTSSLYVFSSGRHLIAEALDKTNVTNLRVVYSTTFARIRWEVQNLSEIYKAKCDARGGCLGLDAPLSTTTQRLLVDAKALPLDQLSPIKYDAWWISNGSSGYAADYSPQHALEIVAVRRPFEVMQLRSATLRSTNSSTHPTLQDLQDTNTTTTDDTKKQHSWLGDVLLNHNVQRPNASRFPSTGTMSYYPVCALAYDRRVQNYISNHIYMETTLQATYTAAAFFLFQNGMARDVLNQPSALKLDKNIQTMSVWLLVPKLNAYLTLSGCMLLVMTLVLALVRLHFVPSAQLITSQPHQIARVMADDTTFPSLLLKRQVNLNDIEGDANLFYIHALAVQPTKDNEVTDTV